MIFYCDAHNTTHGLTPGQIERVVYALSGEVASALCEPDGDRIYAGENAWERFPCVLDYLSLSNSPEGYLELVDPWVTARQTTSPDLSAPSAEAIDAGARALAASLNLDYDSIDPASREVLRQQVAVALTAAAQFTSASTIAEREHQLTRELYALVYPSDSWPDRPLDTVWKHLLDQIGRQLSQQDTLRAAAIQAAEHADEVTSDNASLAGINENLQHRLRDMTTALNDVTAEAARLRHALKHQDQIARMRTVLAELNNDEATEMVRGLHLLLGDYEQQRLIEATPDDDCQDDDEFVGFHG